MNVNIPSLFVSHGNPMVALDKAAGREYKEWADQLPLPKALLIFSAHWEKQGLIFGELNRHDKLVYDFYGFPDALHQLKYPAPGAAWLASEITKLVGEDIPKSERGLDHGVWVPLLHMWPDANIPILQMSLPIVYSNQDLFELGRRLAPLRQQGVMIIGAGTLTHNIQEGLTGGFQSTPDWVRDFDAWLEQALFEDRRQLLDWETLAPHAQQNHPTPEHFRPLLISMGAATDEEPVSFPTKGFDMHVFSKRSVQFG